jgi:hypothetical protein
MRRDVLVVEREFTQLMIVEWVTAPCPAFCESAGGEGDERRKPILNDGELRRPLEDIVLRRRKPIIFIVETRQADGFEVRAEKVSDRVLQMALETEKIFRGQRRLGPLAANIEHDHPMVLAKCRQGKVHAAWARA